MQIRNSPLLTGTFAYSVDTMRFAAATPTNVCDRDNDCASCRRGLATHSIMGSGVRTAPWPNTKGTAAIGLAEAKPGQPRLDKQPQRRPPPRRPSSP